MGCGQPNKSFVISRVVTFTIVLGLLGSGSLMRSLNRCSDRGSDLLGLLASVVFEGLLGGSSKKLSGFGFRLGLQFVIMGLSLGGDVVLDFALEAVDFVAVPTSLYHYDIALLI
jgi:hypothetical protein